MWEQQDEPAPFLPFALAGEYELIDDYLGAIGEVAKLCLPGHETIRMFDRISVLETDRRKLREIRINETHSCRLKGPLLERNPLLTRVVVDQCSVTMAEGAAFGVFA